MALERASGSASTAKAPISFAEYMELALYEPTEGFFTRGGGAGRAGRDFVTSPEVGSLFGMVIARALDDAWRRMGEPDPFVVVEAGAGRGRLAADVVRAAPACAGALRYVLVERSASLREEQRERLALEPPDEALGPFMVSDDGESREPVPGRGPIVTALDDLPAVRIRGRRARQRAVRQPAGPRGRARARRRLARGAGQRRRRPLRGGAGPGVTAARRRGRPGGRRCGRRRRRADPGPERGPRVARRVAAMLVQR